jgi:hypothetical protein
VLAVSELTWLTPERPEALERRWAAEHPEVDTASPITVALEGRGFSPLGCFPLPRRCWLDNCCRPLQARFPAFLERHAGSEAAAAIVAAEEAEIALCARHAEVFGYGFYVARRVGD